MSAGSILLRTLASLATPLLAVPLLACGSRPSGGLGPGVILIAVDALRADHLGVSGYDRDTSPMLHELARDGLCFEQVFASAPLLLPAHVALLTGCDPSVARRFLAEDYEGPSERRWRIPPRAPPVATEFLAAGYATAAFVEHELLSDAYGFGRGFQRYDMLDPEEAERWEGPQETRVVEHFLQWLSTLPPGRPWFAYLHLNELERFWSDPGAGREGFFQPRPELSFIPPVANTDSVFFAIPRSRWRGGVRTLGQYEAAYDDEIRRVDAEIGRLCASLRRLGRYESTSIHVVGAFGMQLGEAGMLLASGRYSTADLSVPWILRPRAGGGFARGRSIAGLVSTLDVAPTLLELEGIPVPRKLHGLSQATALRTAGAPALPRPFVFASCGLQEGCAVIGERHVLEYLQPRGTADAQMRRSWTGEWTGMTMQQRLCFYDRFKTPYPPLDVEGNLARDLESRSATEGEEPVFALYRAAAVEWLRDMRDAGQFLQSPPGALGMDEEVLRRLRDKGYLLDVEVEKGAP